MSLTVACHESTTTAQVDPTAETGLARNVLLVFLEDQGIQAGAFETPGISTPNFDGLAEQGTLMERAYVNLASCTGAKSAIYTGLYNHTIGVSRNVQDYIGSAEQLAAENPPFLSDPDSAYNLHKIKSNHPTIVQRLVAAGYFTGLQNKLHVAPHSKFPFDLWYTNGGNEYDKVLGFIIQARLLQKNWFLVHVLNTPHRPYPDSDKRQLDIDPAQLELPGHLYDSQPIRQDWAEYFQAIEDADKQLGNVLQALDDSGERENTLVVVIGDHGPAYHRGKSTAYDLGLHVPVVFSGPDIAVQRSKAVFSGVDVMPTLLDYLDLSPPTKTHGYSFTSVLSGASSGSPRKYALGTAMTDFSITDGEYRLIFMPNSNDTFISADNRDYDPWRNRVYVDILSNADDPAYAQAYKLMDIADASLPRYERPREEFYHTSVDPWEVVDLASTRPIDSNYTRLRSALTEMLDNTDAPGPRP